MNIIDPRSSKLGGKNLAAELGIAPGAGDRANVNHSLDFVGTEQFEEGFPSAVGMTYGVNRSHDLDILSSDPTSFIKRALRVDKCHCDPEACVSFAERWIIHPSLSLA
jgi:hypothetical protein